MITDFAAGDIIDLSDVDAKSLMDGNQDFTFIGNVAFSNVAGELRYANGFLSGDLNGDSRADFRIEVANGYAITAADLIL